MNEIVRDAEELARTEHVREDLTPEERAMLKRIHSLLDHIADLESKLRTLEQRMEEV